MTFGSSDEARAAVVETAIREVGKTDPSRYWTVCDAGAVSNDWSGPFALWCLVATGVVDWKWSVGSGFLYRLPVAYNGREQAAAPHPFFPARADLVYLQAPVERHGIVIDVFEDAVRIVSGDGKGGRVTDVRSCRAAARFLFRTEQIFRRYDIG